MHASIARDVFTSGKMFATVRLCVSAADEKKRQLEVRDWCNWWVLEISWKVTAILLSLRRYENPDVFYFVTHYLTSQIRTSSRLFWRNGLGITPIGWPFYMKCITYIFLFHYSLQETSESLGLAIGMHYFFFLFSFTYSEPNDL